MNINKYFYIRLCKLWCGYKIIRPPSLVQLKNNFLLIIISKYIKYINIFFYNHIAIYYLLNYY